MKIKPLLGLALLLTCCLASDCLASTGGQTNDASTVTGILETNWTDTSVIVYRAAGGSIHLPARRAMVTESDGPYTYNLFVTAFVDPKTENAWLGVTSDFPSSRDSFYFESKEGIYWGRVLFMVAALGAVMPWEHDAKNGSLASGEVQWWGSLVPHVKRGETVDDVIQQCDQNGGCKWAVREWRNCLHTSSRIENSLQRVENGLNPWLFVDEDRGPGIRVTTIKSIKIDGSKLQLELFSPSAAHTASVWIDPKTWNVVKVIQDIDMRPGKAASASAVKLRFISVDSEETTNENGAGKNAVDGNPNTYWHTQWHDNSPGLPHEIILQLDPSSIIKGFAYLPRQDESDHGAIKDYEFYVSNDGTNFGEPVSEGTFRPGKGERVETFEPIKCRFIKLKAISEINGLPWTSAAEIRVIRPGESTSPRYEDRFPLTP